MKWKSGLGACGSFLSYCFLMFVDWLNLHSKMIHDVLMMIFRESNIKKKNIIMLPSFWRFLMFGWFLPSSGPRGLSGSPCSQQDHVSRESQQPKHHLVTWEFGAALGWFLQGISMEHPCQSMPRTPHRLGYNPFDYGILWPYYGHIHRLHRE